MGLFWDLIQQNQISNVRDRSESLERRIDRLEEELRSTRALLHTLLERLEKHFGEDLNRDGRIG